MSRTHLEIIDFWDSIQAFADAIGVNLVAARKMRFRQRIPSAHFPAVLKTKKAKAKRVTFQELHAGTEKIAKRRAAAKPERGIAA